MKIIACSIDLSKLDKSRIKTHDKDGNPYKNGAKYYEFSVLLSSEPDKFGHHASIVESQTKEEREAKTAKKYIGNGKTVFSNSKEKESPKEEATKPQGKKLPY